jgi:acetyl esterase/lipase
MDIYYPRPPAQISQATNYVFLIIHGGEFAGENKSDFSEVVSSMITMSPITLTMVAINYRNFECGYNYKDMLDDIALALRFIYDNQALYRFRASTVAILGNSFGGYLGLMYALTMPSYALSAPMPHVPLVATFSAMTNLTRGHDFYAGMTEAERTQFFSNLLGEEVTAASLNEGKHDAALSLASPINHITPNAPALFMAHGSNDNRVHVSNMIDVENKYQDMVLGNKIKTLMFDGLGHNIVHNDKVVNESIIEIALLAFGNFL